MLWMMGRLLANKSFKTYTIGIKTATPVSSTIISRIYYSNTVKDDRTVTDVENTYQEKKIDTNETIANSKKKPIKSTKYIFIFLGISITTLGLYIMYDLGKHGETNVEYPLWKQRLINLRNKIDHFAIFIQEPSRDKLLPDPMSYPYYQPPYTLVLEFTDVLAHPDWTYKTGWRFKKRPGLDYMLESLVGMFEIVVFTAEPGMIIFPVIEALDQKNLISYKLVRDSTHFVEGHHVKNLDKLNRDLKKVIVVDWDPHSLKFHPDNQFKIPRWKGDNEDGALVDLTSFLKTIAHTEIQDVRDVLKFYKQFDDPLSEFRNKQQEYYEQRDQGPTEKPNQSIKKVFEYIM